MARERYLLDAGEDTIHSNVITADTPKEKRQNWWYYHQRHVVIGTICAALVFSLFYSIFSKVEPDYTVALLTSYNMPESGMRELERCITPYADDRNGDGKIVVSIASYVLSDEIPASSDAYAEQQANVTRFVADISVNESMLFIHDETAFSSFEDQFGGFFLDNEGNNMPAGEMDFTDAMLPWSDVKVFAEFQPEAQEGETFTSEDLSELFSRLRVSFRAKDGTSIEKKAKHVEYWEASLGLYDRLKTGTLPEAGQ